MMHLKSNNLVKRWSAHFGFMGGLYLPVTGGGRSSYKHSSFPAMIIPSGEWQIIFGVGFLVRGKGSVKGVRGHDTSMGGLNVSVD